MAPCFQSGRRQRTHLGMSPRPAELSSHLKYKHAPLYKTVSGLVTQNHHFESPFINLDFFFYDCQFFQEDKVSHFLFFNSITLTLSHSFPFRKVFKCRMVLLFPILFDSA